MKKKQLGTDVELAREDLIQSHRHVNDTIKDLWIGYEDPAGKTASSPNSYMTLRKHWNRLFGITSIKELIGDIERCLLYALANVRAEKAIRQGVEQKQLRADIREKTYQIFEQAGSV